MIKKILPIILVISVFALLALPVGAFHSVSYEDENRINITAPMVELNYDLNGSTNTYLEQLPTVYPSISTYSDVVTATRSGDTVHYSYSNPLSYNPSTVRVVFPSIVITSSGVSTFQSPRFDALNGWDYEYDVWLYDANGVLLYTYPVGGFSSSFDVYHLPTDIDDIDEDILNRVHTTIYSDVVVTAINPTISGADFTVSIPYRPSEQVQDVVLANPSNTIIVRDVADVGGVGDFLFNSVSGFFSFEIMPGISLYTLLLAIAGAFITLWVLRLIAGG